MSRSSCALLLFALLLGALPSLALACACCGEQNTWNAEVIKPGGYGWDVLKDLKPGPGTILYSCDECATEDEWQILSVSHEGAAYRFEAKGGAIVFTGSGWLEHRQTDISFITQSEIESVMDSHILNELVLVGSVKFEGEEWPNAKPLQNASLVLRGVGNNCYEKGTFSRWLLRADSKGRALAGGGAML